MIKILDYSEIKITLLDSTKDPLSILAVALDLNMNAEPKWRECTVEKLRGVVKKNHTNCLEFIDYTFLISGLSKSAVGQLTRHRLAAYSATSQHYQNFSGRGYTIDKNKMTSESEELLIAADLTYSHLIEKGIPKEEARQYLPTSSTQSILVKMNARSLGNFLRLRTCKRNCLELMLIAWKIQKLCKDHFPELWSVFGLPGCLDKGCCEGKMACGKPYEK